MKHHALPTNKMDAPAGGASKGPQTLHLRGISARLIFEPAVSEWVEFNAPPDKI